MSTAIVDRLLAATADDSGDSGPGDPLATAAPDPRTDQLKRDTQKSLRPQIRRPAGAGASRVAD
ncbi:MAG: hypothetical protein QM820_54130 [Minicystis sp.]